MCLDTTACLVNNSAELRWQELAEIQALVFYRVTILSKSTH